MKILTALILLLSAHACAQDFCTSADTYFHVFIKPGEEKKEPIDGHINLCRRNNSFVLQRNGAERTVTCHGRHITNCEKYEVELENLQR